MNSRILFLVSIFTFLVISCKKSGKKEVKNEETTTISSDKIKSILDSSMANINSTWDSVISADDQKMADIKRLLDEVSYAESSDEKQLKKMFALFDSVQQTRYTLANLNDAKIDEYDIMQDRLISSTNQLAESTPNIEAHPLAIELMNDISEADGMTFSKRGDYDIWAKKINTMVTKYPKMVKELGEPYAKLETYGTFAPDDGF